MTTILINFIKTIWFLIFAGISFLSLFVLFMGIISFILGLKNGR